MSLSIRTNVASLNAQRNLTATQNTLDSSLSRLSSGFRITKAGDDAAGLGISTKLESQIHSYNQATRNANDGLSVVQATESALNEQASILTRLRELAMQSSSDGIGNTERGYVDKEAQALVSELERIAQVTEYNGTKLLDGTNASGLDFQVGIANTGNDVISLNTLNATTAVATAASPPNASTFQVAAAAAYTKTLEATGDQAQAVADATTAAANAGADPAIATTFAWITMGVVGSSYFLSGDPLPWQNDAMPASLTRTAALTIANASASGGAGGDPALGAAFQAYVTKYNSSGGNRFQAQSDASAAWESFALGLGVTALDAVQGGGMVGITVDYIFQNASDVAGGGSAGEAAGLAQLSGSVAPGGAGTAGGLGVAGLSLTTKASSLSALSTIDAALATVSSNRAELGATGNRLQSAVNNIQAFSESLSAANSRIKDVDVAEETSRMSRAQILSQAGVSVLAQANQMPQLALKLLG
jgi:flagellin